jgi:hypothetical protein
VRRADEDSQVAVLRWWCRCCTPRCMLEGAHNEVVHQLLDASDVWAAYRDRRHHLFLPSGASQGSSVVGLLEAGGAARYALPAPEAINGCQLARGDGKPGALAGVPLTAWRCCGSTCTARPAGGAQRLQVGRRLRLLWWVDAGRAGTGTTCEHRAFRRPPLLHSNPDTSELGNCLIRSFHDAPLWTQATEFTHHNHTFTMETQNSDKLYCRFIRPRTCQQRSR